jgi:zinc protease
MASPKEMISLALPFGIKFAPRIEKSIVFEKIGRQTERRFIPSAALLIVFILLPSGLFSNTLFSSEETAKYLVLDNGLKVFLMEKRNVPLVNIVAAVDLGSKDETAETSGVVHVLEHYILFRGTEVRSGNDIGRDVRRNGAYFNAHTGNDLAFFEISVPTEAVDFALGNQREILFRLKITQAELDAEKEIILEEFRQLEDDPFRYATALVYQNLFRGHPYSQPLIGDAEVIQRLSAEEVAGFYRRFFVPSNCALAIVGDFAVTEMEGKVREFFGEIQGEHPVRAKIEQALPPSDEVDLEVEMDVQKAYLVIAVQAPGFNNPEQYSMDVLTEILGRGINPLLYSALSRGPRRLIETLSMAYLTHKYGGVLLAFLTLDPRNLNGVKREAVRYLRKAREENFSPDDVLGVQQMFAYDRLGSAQNHIKYRAYRFQERGLSMAASLAQFMILREGEAERKFLENIDLVKSGDLRKTATNYLSRANYILVSILPKKAD